MTPFDPDKQQQFAEDVVGRLREAGFEAYWAGGCVRDQMMGRRPKDFDVATSATPEQIRELFGRRRTLAIGAAFGVITVLGGKPLEPIEVATFRRDAAYSDGRHPDSVTFSSAEEDASRRDFTINGLFYDPVEKKVIDFVGGCEDMQRRVIRAIGCPRDRITEDKLRMLRAVRFAAALEFEIDEETFLAVREMADQIGVVSAERIAAEVTKMLIGRNRVRAIELLLESGLAEHVLPEIVVAEEPDKAHLEQSLAALGKLDSPGFPLSLATLLHKLVDATAAGQICARWRLSNQHTERTCWLIEQHGVIDDAQAMPWSRLQPILTSPGIGDLLALHEATDGDAAALTYCREKLSLPPDQLDPPPLLTGGDLIALGIPTGPLYSVILKQVRDAQLDGLIADKQQAVAMAEGLRE